jgi:uncharacterized protein (TIGR00304 family)
MMGGQLLFTVGVVLILAGFVAFFVGGLLLFFRALRGKGRVKGGGLVMIGPFPIVFGTDKESVKAFLLLSIVLIVLVLIFMIFSCYVLW